jgi:hypothetical protein
MLYPYEVWLKIGKIGFYFLKILWPCHLFSKKRFYRIHSRIYLVAKWQIFTHTFMHIKMLYAYFASIQQWCGKWGKKVIENKK